MKEPIEYWCDRLVDALETIMLSVDDSLLLDENLYKDWGKLWEEVVKARQVIKEYRDSDCNNKKDRLSRQEIIDRLVMDIIGEHSRNHKEFYVIKCPHPLCKALMEYGGGGGR